MLLDGWHELGEWPPAEGTGELHTCTKSGGRYASLQRDGILSADVDADTGA